MIARLGQFVVTLILAAFVLGGGLAVLAGGYWLSDRVYDAGLWPIGVVMRVALLLMLASFGFGGLFLVFGAFANLFRGSSDVWPEYTVDEALADLETAYGLGGAALIVNRGLRILLTGLTIPATQVGCLLGFVHLALMIVTFGIYALLWTVLWLPFLGVALGTSWLWSKAPILWPVWVVVGVPFLLVAYVLVLLGPRDVGGEDKKAKLGMLMAWPYTYFRMFEMTPEGSYTQPEEATWESVDPDLEDEDEKL